MKILLYGGKFRSGNISCEIGSVFCSSRLLVTGLQNKIRTSSVTIIDEVEHGLEPYRILRLLDELGAKSDEPNAQVFMPTHSPIVLRELKAWQLSIVRTSDQPGPEQQSSLMPIIPIGEEE